jgi:hypothetical protein
MTLKRNIEHIPKMLRLILTNLGEEVENRRETELKGSKYCPWDSLYKQEQEWEQVVINA